MMSKECLQYSLIDTALYIRNELTARRRSSYEDHLNNCDYCRDQVAAVRAVLDGESLFNQEELEKIDKFLGSDLVKNKIERIVRKNSISRSENFSDEFPHNN